MLRITGRRADGYHLLQTVFQFLDLCDDLRFEITPHPEIELTTPLPGVPPEKDLTVRAARLLQKAAGVKRGVRIWLRKKIPMGGGLGGGSSDAATTLWALNRLWGIHWPRKRLMELGVQLGADVPIFLLGRAAWAEGIGERLQPIELEEPWYLLLFPGVEVSTAQIFQDPDLSRHNPPLKREDFLQGTRPNDCLETTLRHYPAVAEAFADLKRFGAAFMTGTGSTLFAPFKTRARARRVAEELQKKWRVSVVRGRNLSPLFLL